MGPVKGALPFEEHFVRGKKMVGKLEGAAFAKATARQGGQRADDRGRRADDRGRRADDRGRKAMAPEEGQKSWRSAKARHPAPNTSGKKDSRRAFQRRVSLRGKAEDRGKRTEDGGQMAGPWTRSIRSALDRELGPNGGHDQWRDGKGGEAHAV
jgi:hypothetical protein